MDVSWQLELQALLELLASSPSPVGSAVRWVESHGRTGVGCNRSGIGSLWRLVPDVLAKEVVFLEEPPPGGTVRNCLWLQTLPVALQASILTFLTTEHVRFRMTDLKLLARRLLSSREIDYWVSRAAQILLTTTSGGMLYSTAEVEDREGVANRLLQLPAGEGSIFGWLPAACSALKNRKKNETEAPEGWDAESAETKQIVGKRRKLDYEDNNAVHSGQENKQSDAQLALTSSAILELPLPSMNDVARSPNQAEGSQIGAQDTDEGILGSEVFNRARSLTEAFTSNQPAAGHIQEAVELFRITPDLSVLLRVLRPWEIDDDVTLLLVGSLLGDQEGYAWSSQIMGSLLLPKLQDLKQPASRVLLMALVQAAKAQPRASVDSILVPLLNAKEGASPLQCEVINRVIKDCLTVSSVSLLLGKILSPESGKGWGASALQQESFVTGVVWTEAMVGVLQNLLNFRGLSLEGDVINALVSSLEGVADQFAESLKFGNFLLSLATKHSGQLNASHVKLLHQVAGRTTTFLSKSLVAKLNRL